MYQVLFTFRSYHNTSSLILGGGEGIGSCNCSLLNLNIKRGKEGNFGDFEFSWPSFMPMLYFIAWTHFPFPQIKFLILSCRLRVRKGIQGRVELPLGVSSGMGTSLLLRGLTDIISVAQNWVFFWRMKRGLHALFNNITWAHTDWLESRRGGDSLGMWDAHMTSCVRK